LRDPDTGERRFARVKVPQILPRLLEVEPSHFVLIDQVIEANLDALFSGMEVEEHHLFRVTRNADLALEEDEADDLLLAIEEELRRRRFGEAVRLEVERSMPATTRALLLRGLGLDDADCYDVSGMLDLTGLWSIAELDRPDLKPAPWTPVTPPRLIPPDEDEPADIFAAIRAGDVLVHHPYESFGASVERFITQAADDPDVLTIKQTLYRTTGDSPILQALIRAAERGKQVVVLVEIKARFDEEANIVWARKLERAGAHVVYGLVGLKTHSKTALVVRREGSGLRRYVHIGTGNYNHKTARTYTDLGLLTCRPEIGADVTDLFNVLTGLSRQRAFRRILVAPHSLRSRFLDLVTREVGHVAAGRPGRIILKLNAIVDVAVIEALYEAAQAGVDIEMIVRGACSIQPGLPGMSERIRVRSIIGEFLEHSRIWGFENGGDREWYIGSADLMDRNLDRRIEAVAPVEDPEARTRLASIIEVMLADDRRSWQLQPDATWVRTEALLGRAGTVDTFEVLKEDALNRGLVAAAPHRPGAGAGSLDPRA
jgi:polyphosphate kinase